MKAFVYHVAKPFPSEVCKPFQNPLSMALDKTPSQQFQATYQVSVSRLSPFMSTENRTPNMALTTTPSQQFQVQYQDSVALYGELANEIREFIPLKISDKLLEISNDYSDLKDCNPEMVRKTEGVVVKCQEMEVEAQKYVVKAKNFAQGNKIVAQNVLDGKPYYRPESILKHFRRTAENLDDAFTAVVEKHFEIEKSIASISHQTKHAWQDGGQLNFVPKGFPGLAGFDAGILQGTISTALLGIPAYAAAEAKERLEELKKMFEATVEFLQRLDQLIKNHKKLLTDITACVSQLPIKYEELGEDYKSGTLELYQIDLFKNTCDNIIEACDVYLTAFPLK